MPAVARLAAAAAALLAQSALVRGLARPAARATPVVEVVLAHYAEDLAWTQEYRELPGVQFTVYSKSARPSAGVVRLPNFGREAHTYLHHIVQHYHDLAPWTVFSQAVRPSWGFEGGNSMSGHLSDNTEFLDYLRPYPGGEDAYFVFSAATHFPKGLQTSRVGMLYQNLRTRSKDPCPLNGADGWGLWWYDPTHPHVTMANPTLTEFYHKHIAMDEDDGQPITLAFPQGARFSVSRERIQARPLEYYQRLLALLSTTSNPIEGYWMEAAWFDVFHPEALQSKAKVCPLPPLPAAPADSAQQASELVRRRLQLAGDIPVVAGADGGRGYDVRVALGFGVGYAAHALPATQGPAPAPGGTVDAGVPALLV